MTPLIPAHSPFMPTHTGRCVLAICGEATQMDIIQTASCSLDAAIEILHLALTSPAPNDHLNALYGAIRLMELAAGMVASLENVQTKNGLK